MPTGAFLPDLLLRLYRSYSLVGFETEAGTMRERLLSEFPESEETRLLLADEDPAAEEDRAGDAGSRR